jgi:uncharacterized membrane protein
MTNPSAETQIATLREQLDAMRDRLSDMRTDVEALQEERNRVMALGSAVMGMAYWIFNAITVGHFK